MNKVELVLIACMVVSAITLPVSLYGLLTPHNSTAKTTTTPQCSFSVNGHCYQLPKNVTTLDVNINRSCPVIVNGNCLEPVDKPHSDPIEKGVAA